MIRSHTPRITQRRTLRCLMRNGSVVYHKADYKQIKGACDRASLSLMREYSFEPGCISMRSTIGLCLLRVCGVKGGVGVCSLCA